MRNQWLIAVECHARGITPTYVAGFRAFLALNRCVRKGEKAIKILGPVAVKQRDDDGEETGEKRIFFRTVAVFDVSQTDPLPGTEPVPLAPPAQPIEGDSHAHLVAPLQELARELGYRVEIRDLPDDGPGGWCDHKHQQIVVAIGPPNREVRTLVPWRRGRIPTFGMPPSRGRCWSVVRAGRSEARRASGDPSGRGRSGAGGGGEAGVARPIAGGGAAPVVGGVVAVAEQLAEDGGGDAGGECEQRRGAAGLGVDAKLAQAAADALGPDVGARFGAGQQPRSGGLGVHGAEQCGEWVWDLDRVLAELEETCGPSRSRSSLRRVTMRVTRWP